MSDHPLLFEASWEVCSQVGGIYTVLRSKAPAAVRHWGKNYWMIGPYHEHAAQIEFEPETFDDPIVEAIADVRALGIEVHAGHWLVSGRPRVLLIDYRPRLDHLGEMKYFVWKDLNIALPENDPATDEIVAFGYSMADLMEAVHKRTNQRPMLLHCHEWQGAAAIPLLAHRQANFPTVFTTHATLVGRSLSAANVDLYGRLAAFDPDKVAAEHGIKHRHDIERAAATTADVFTTVSEITAQESEVFLGRRPETVLPNGLNVERFAAPHEFQNLHQKCKERIHEFVMAHFFPSYAFDLNRTLYVMTAGRYEYRNKGLDVYIESLYELNRRLKAESEGVTVVAFIITRAPYRGINVETLNRQAMFSELHETCQAIQDDMGRQLFLAVSQGRLPTSEELLDEYARVRLKRMMHAWMQRPQPMIVTHDLEDDLNDSVLRHLRSRKLLNAPDDPVKVIFHPDFITSTSPILGLEYDQFVRGCNVGVFPSYYEPWGYTPMECIIRGVPAITSDLSGFGAYVMDNFVDHDANGLFVARRRDVDFESTVLQVANWLHDLTRLPLRDRIQMRNRVEAYAEYFDWTRMTRYYRSARRLAYEKYYPPHQVLKPERGAVAVR